MTKYFTIANFFKILFLVLILAVSFYFFVYTRRIGCMDKKALNYNINNNIDDPTKCIYPYKGCRDKEATNYNLFATISCTEDCKKWLNDEKNLNLFKIRLDKYKKDPETFKIKIRELEEKIRRMTQNVGKYEKLCKYHRPCTIKNLRSFQDRECEDCLCIPNYDGCTREWCVNYNKLESRDITSVSDINGINNLTDFSLPLGCVDVRDLLNRIYVLASGNCKYCDDKVIIKLDDKYLIDDNRDGLYLMIIKRNIYFDDYKYYRFTNGNDLIFQLNNVDPDDIIVIAAKMNTTVYLSSKNKIDLYNKLNANKIEINQGDNYILITSLKGDVHYENRSSSTEVFYPSYKIDCIGCFQLDKNKIKKLNKNERLFLNTNKINKSSNEFINRCALEAKSDKKNSFIIIDNDCYLLNNDIIEDTKGKVKIEYGGFNGTKANFKYVKKGSYYNRNSVGISSENSCVIYHISDSFFNDIEMFDAAGNSNRIKLYTNPEFKGLEIILGEGANSIRDLLNLNYQDSSMAGLGSAKIPNKMLVTILKKSNNKKVSLLGGAGQGDLNVGGKPVATDSKKDGERRVNNIIGLMSTLVSSPAKEFKNNITIEVKYLTNQNKLIEADNKKLDYQIKKGKENLVIAIKDSFYSIISKTVGWTSQDDEIILEIFFSLNNLLFDTMESINKTNKEILTDHEKNLLEKAKKINTQIKNEQTKLDRFIRLKANVIKRSKEEILAIYSLEDIEKEIDERENNKKNSVDVIIYNAFYFLKLVLDDISSYLDSKKPKNFPNQSYQNMIAKRLELYTTLSQLKDSNNQLNQINDKTNKTNLDNILLIKLSDLIPLLIEILLDQSDFKFKENLRGKLNSAEMFLNSINQAKIDDLINNDPEASIIKKKIDNLNLELAKLNNSRKLSTVDILLKNTNVPLTKGEIEKLESDPSFQRLPDSSRQKLIQNVIKSKESINYLLDKKEDYNTSTKINNQKIDFLNKLKKDYMEDLEFTTSNNDDVIYITNVTNRIILFELNNLNGMSVPIPFGKYNLPSNYWITVGSIMMMDNRKDKPVCITLFSETDFKKEIGYFHNSFGKSINKTNSYLVGEYPDGTPILYNRMIPVKSIIVEYLMPTEFFYYSKRQKKEFFKPSQISPFLKSSSVRLYIRSIRGPITRLKINQPRYILFIYGKFINSWGQTDDRIVGYAYNEFYDRSKEVNYLLDASKNKIRLDLYTVTVTHFEGKHMTEELFLKYKL